MKKQISYITAMLIMVAAFVIGTADPVTAGTRDCDYPSCTGSCVEGGRYCSVHTCRVKGCKGLRWSDKVPYCYEHRCNMKDCTNPHAEGSRYCSAHEKAGKVAEKKMWDKYNSEKKKNSSNKQSSGGTDKRYYTGKNKKKYDPYDVYDYKSAQDFADDKYEEFYDYEDDFEDEDEAYDAAEDYWREHYCSVVNQTT